MFALHVVIKMKVFTFNLILGHDPHLPVLYRLYVCLIDIASPSGLTAAARCFHPIVPCLRMRATYDCVRTAGRTASWIFSGIDAICTHLLTYSMNV